MPVYTYRCPECQAILERTHASHETPLVLCPDCGQSARKVILESPHVSAQSKAEPPAGEPSAPARDAGGEATHTCALHQCQHPQHRHAPNRDSH